MRVLGAMSGTSLDGVDAAVLVTDGAGHLEFGETAFRAYSGAEQEILRAALGQWSGPQVEAAGVLIEQAHAELLGQFEDIDLIGFHGQTLAHDPSNGRTLQVGNGAVLAEALGAPMVWDFRSNDVEMGGQGAPLAPFYHHALARHIGADAPVAFLNLGGVGNLTWVDPAVAAPEDEGALLAFDTGPANAPINDLIMAWQGRPFDRDGATAAGGRVDEAVMGAFLENAYFYKIPPKSLDRDAFADMVQAAGKLGDTDGAATLTACAAAAVMRGMEHCPRPPSRLLVTGGGRHNPTMMAMIAAGVDCPVVPVEEAGLDGDMLEAQAFAYLAARVVRGLPTSAPSTTGVRAAVGGGRISGA